jgi:3-methyladenine DNA glycosylase AlkD
MKTNLAPLINNMRLAANPEKAIWSENYLKNQFKCLGISSADRKQILKSFLVEYGLPDFADLKDVCYHLWKTEEREFQYVALEILQKAAKKLRKEDILWIEELIITKSWWDTVDGLAGWICGKYFQLYPEQIQKINESWLGSNNIWLQRSTLLFQLKYKKNTDTELLTNNIIYLADHKNFFIRKAIGWILREYSKTNKIWVKEFINQYELSGLSYREAAKYI